MSTAERLRAEQRAEVLIELLTVKFGSLAAETIETIHAADPAQVQTWTLRVLTADTLDDVFA